MKENKRGLRRQANERILNKAKKIAKSWLNKEDEHLADGIARHIRDNRKPCSCPLCCNKRRKDSLNSKGKNRLTIQERKNLK